MDMLEVNSTDVLHAVLKVVNQIIENDRECQGESCSQCQGESCSPSE